MITMIVKTYSELMSFRTFEERFQYLYLGGVVGEATFGLDRYLNQKFYNSEEWRSIRDFVIVRDNACDLCDPDREILGQIIVHHMNPVTIEDLEMGNDLILDPEFLVCTSLNTHNGIHFGGLKSVYSLPTFRRKGDTTPWRVY